MGSNNSHVASLPKADLARYMFAQVHRIQDNPEAVQRALAVVMPFVPFDLLQMRVSERALNGGEFDVEKFCKGLM